MREGTPDSSCRSSPSPDAGTHQCQAQAQSSLRRRRHRTYSILRVPPVGFAVVAVLSLLLVHSCLPAMGGLDLIVNPAFRNNNFPAEKGAPNVDVAFILNSRLTPILTTNFEMPLLTFTEDFTYVAMDWRVKPGELATYTMNIMSGDVSIMAQPETTVPLEGNVTSTQFMTFNTTLPCTGRFTATTLLSVDMIFTVFALDNNTNQYELTVNETLAGLRMRKKCDKVVIPPTVGTTPESDNQPLIVGVSVGGAFLLLFLILLFAALRYNMMKNYGRHPLEERNSPDDRRPQGTDSGYSGTGYTRTQGNNLMPLEKEEIAIIMAKLRKEWSETLDGFLLPRDIIEQGHEIGRGAFGRVLTGKILATDPPREVAIKTLKSVSAISDLDEFLEEAVVMKEFDHPNVVALMGVCIEGVEPPLVCLELMREGDLRSYLRRSRGLEPQHGPVGEISVAQLLEFCAMILDGMAYLAAQNFVHRDLATRNCMLNSELVVKIGDFGLARDIHGEDYYVMGTPRRLPVKWMAFESLQDQVFNSLTDVWSYGVVMWEVFSLGQSPYPGVDNSEIIEYLFSGRRLARPAKCPEDFYNLMLSCWNIDKKIRPTFKQLVPMLEDYRDVFYENVEVKDRDALTFSNMALKNGANDSQRSRLGRTYSHYSGSGSINTVQTDLQYTGSMHYSGSVGQYSKANRPSDEFLKRVAQTNDNPNYSAMPVQAPTESYNPNYHPTEVVDRVDGGNAAAVAAAAATQPGYPVVGNSCTPANIALVNSSPPRASLDLPSPVQEESTRHSHGFSSSSSNSTEAPRGNRMELSQSSELSLNEQRRMNVVEVEL